MYKMTKHRCLSFTIHMYLSNHADTRFTTNLVCTGQSIRSYDYWENIGIFLL